MHVQGLTLVQPIFVRREIIEHHEKTQGKDLMAKEDTNPPVDTTSTLLLPSKHNPSPNLNTVPLTPYHHCMSSCIEGCGQKKAPNFKAWFPGISELWCK